MDAVLMSAEPEGAAHGCAAFFDEGRMPSRKIPATTTSRVCLVPTATGAFVGAAEAASFPADGAHHEKLAASAAPTERLAASAAPARSPDAGLVMAMAVRRRPTGGECGDE